MKCYRCLNIHAWKYSFAWKYLKNERSQTFSSKYTCESKIFNSMGKPSCSNLIYMKLDYGQCCYLKDFIIFPSISSIVRPWETKMQSFVQTLVLIKPNVCNILLKISLVRWGYRVVWGFIHLTVFIYTLWGMWK